ncbi:hypothetical protein [Gordonia araii]|nr:hypothetical protein [Gordonia araii]NNG96786.1 hypothetical protein [Gordonia araii NBRC 100433]
MNRTVYDMAKLAPRLSTAQNLMSCAYSYTMGDPGSEMPKEHGDQRPMERFAVEGESAMYTRGEFAGFSADGRPSRVVQIRSRAMPEAAVRQYGFTLMSGTRPANKIWVITAEEYPDMATWVPDLRKWNPAG